jgi:hypothetical protein
VPSSTLTWFSDEGFDPAKLPIDGILKQAISSDAQQFRSGLGLLECMCGHGRKEAGVFLLGLLVACDADWEKRIAIVEALGCVETKACADYLFSELRRVESSNTTRRYLTTIIKVLATMPSDLVEDEFEALAGDKSFSQKMRAKFKSAVDQVIGRDGGLV